MNCLCTSTEFNCRQGRACPRRRPRDPMESRTVRCVAVLLVVLAFCLVLQRLGIAFNWPL